MSIIGTIFNVVTAGTLYLASQYPAATENLINGSLAKVIALYNKTDLTQRFIESIKNLPILNLGDAIFVRSEDQSLPLQIIRGLFEDLGVGVLGKAISTTVVQAPPLPPMLPEVLKRREQQLKRIEAELEREKQEVEKAKKENVKGAKNFTDFLTAKLTLSGVQRTVARNEDKLSKERSELEKQSAMSTEETKAAVDKIIYKVAKTLFNTLSKVRNTSSVLNIIFIKLTGVLTTLQDIDWVNSSNIEQVFAERLTNNINIGPNGFETFRKTKIKEIRQNVSKILSKIELQGTAGVALTLIRAALNNGPLEKVLRSVIKTVSTRLFDHLSKTLSPKQIQKWIEQGIDLGPLQLFGPKKVFITPDEATSVSLSDDEKIKRNLYAMIEMVVFTLIDVLIDAIANYTDWSSDQRAPAAQNDLQENFEGFLLLDAEDEGFTLLNAEDRCLSDDQKCMPVDLQKNFGSFIDAVGSTVGAVLGSKVQQNSEMNLSVNRPKSEADVGILDIYENLVFRGLLKGVSGAAKLSCWLIKNRTDIKQVVPEFANFLETVAQT